MKRIWFIALYCALMLLVACAGVQSSESPSPAPPSPISSDSVTNSPEVSIMTSSPMPETSPSPGPWENVYPGLRNYFWTEAGYAPITEDEAFVYYATHDAIIKLNKETRTRESIFQGNVSCLILYENRLYFNEGKTMKSMGLYGEDVQVIWEFDGDENFYISPLWDRNGLWYVGLPAGPLTQCDTKTGARELILEDFSVAQLDGDYVYYIEHAERTFSIFRKHLVTGETELIRGNGLTKDSHSLGVRIDDLVFVNHELYYATRFPHRLYKYNADGDDEELVDCEENSSLGMIAYGNDIYYVAHQDLNGAVKLYKLDTVTRDTSFAADLPDYETRWGFIIVDGHVFYNSREGYDDQVVHMVQLDEGQ